MSNTCRANTWVLDSESRMFRILRRFKSVVVLPHKRNIADIAWCNKNRFEARYSFSAELSQTIIFISLDIAVLALTAKFELSPITFGNTIREQSNSFLCSSTSSFVFTSNICRSFSHNSSFLKKKKKMLKLYLTPKVYPKPFLTVLTSKKFYSRLVY